MKSTIAAAIRTSRAAIFSAALFALALAGPALAQDAVDDNRETLGPIVGNARERGFEKCLDRLESITDKVLGETEIGAYIVSNEDHPDAGIYTAMVSRPTGQGGTQMISIAVSADESCSASYEITSVWGAPCRRIGQSQFSDYALEAKLPGNVQVRSAAGKKQVYMVPLPDGCMTIKKETMH